MGDIYSYPFEWLDQVVDVILNPRVTPVDELTATQLQLLGTRLSVNVTQVMLALKTLLFFMGIPEQLGIVTGHAVKALALLLHRARTNASAYPPDGPLHRLGQQLIRELENMDTEIRERFGPYLPQPVTGDLPAPPSGPAPAKLRCRLSVDQLGLILKAADDTRLISSPSLSLVFKAVVPYLSTERKKDLSWDSMRSSTYHPEQSDQETAIAALEKIIRAIRDYK